MSASSSSPSGDAAAGSFRRFGKQLALVVLIITAGAALVAATQVFLLLFMAILLAVFLRAPAGWLAARSRLSERWALLVVTLGLAGLCAGAMALAAPTIGAQAAELWETLPRSFRQTQEQLRQSSWGRAAADAADHADDYLPEDRALLRRAAGVFSSTLSAFSAVLVVLFLGLCLAIEPRTYTGGLVRLLPMRHRPRAREILGELRRVLGTWLAAKLISMSVVGVATAVGLWALGIPMAFVLGVLAGLLAFIPNVGPILSAVPAVLIALAQGPTQALYVVGLYLAVQSVESYVVTPLVQRDMVSLPPALTAFAQLILGLVAGLPGVIVAAPLTAAGLVVVRRVYVEGVLGDTEEKDG